MAFGPSPPLCLPSRLEHLILIIRILRVLPYFLTALVTGTTSLKITRLPPYMNRNIPHKPPRDSLPTTALFLPDTSARWPFGCSGGALAARSLQHPDTVLYIGPLFSPVLPVSALYPHVTSASLHWCSTPGSGSSHCHPNDLTWKGKFPLAALSWTSLVLQSLASGTATLTLLLSGCCFISNSKWNILFTGHKAHHDHLLDLHSRELGTHLKQNSSALKGGQFQFLIYLLGLTVH